MAADIQFIKGVNEPSIPDVNLTRARDGSTGTATFVFGSPSVFEASSELGEITGETSCEGNAVKSQIRCQLSTKLSSLK